MKSKEPKASRVKFNAIRIQNETTLVELEINFITEEKEDFHNSILFD